MNDGIEFGQDNEKFLDDWLSEIKQELTLELQIKSQEYGFDFESGTPFNNRKYIWSKELDPPPKTNFSHQDSASTDLSCSDETERKSLTSSKKDV